MKLRNYQENAYCQLKTTMLDNKRVILCSPTGSGKTVIFSHLVSKAKERGKRVLIVTDRTELLTQSGGALAAHDIKPEKVEQGSKPDLKSQIFIGMVETINRRLAKPEYVEWLGKFDLIIFDEAHKQAFNKLFAHISKDTYVIGATATPYRDGNQECLSEKYGAIVEVITISELIEQGFLSKPRSFGAKVDLSEVKTLAGEYDANSLAYQYDKQKIYQGVVRNYRKICDSKKTLAFCPNIASSKQLLNEFVQSGYDAKHLDSEMSNAERASVLSWYAATPNAILCNVGILTTGFDSPETECVILYRATKSLPLFLQMCGRGARTTATKSEFFILDFGDNIKKHGFWEGEREWDLVKKKKKGEGVAPVKSCPECEYLLQVSIMLCPECGHIFQARKETPKEIELKEILSVKQNWLEKPKFQVLRDALKVSIEDAAKLVKANVIKATWYIYTAISTEEDAKKFAQLCGYKAGWIYYQKQNGQFAHLI
jgi:superfamily II DNA or RNA helicase